jgi:hypothetical protein
MANIKVSSITKKEPPCPGPAPKKPKKFQPAPTDAPGPFPPPPPFFMPGPCCPSTTQILDNITVVSTTPDTIEVQEGTCQGMKAFGVGAKTFEGIGTSGMVPVPQPGDENKVLAGDGSWAEIIISQSDWEQEDDTQPDYIKNKPDIEGMIDDAVSAERDRATTAETNLHNEITTETTRATTEETKLQTEITTEITRAKTGEAAATTEVRAGENATVDEEIAQDGHHIYTVNADGKPQVQADWAQEDDTKVDYIKNRPDIEAMIESAVSTERDRATEAETTLHTEIVAETERATEAETTLHTEIVTETERATEAETNLHTKIDTETERAIAGEAAATTEVVAGNNVTVDNSVAADGHNIYTVTVNECSAAMMDAWLDEVG